MNKQQWQDLYNILDKLHSDFLFAHQDAENGKNKKIREAGHRKAGYAIHTADFNIRQHAEVFNLLTGGEGVDSYGRTIMYDEFLSHRYFGDDMSDFLRKMQEKIKTLE